MYPHQRQDRKARSRKRDGMVKRFLSSTPCMTSMIRSLSKTPARNRDTIREGRCALYIPPTYPVAAELGGPLLQIIAVGKPLRHVGAQPCRELVGSPGFLELLLLSSSSSTCGGLWSEYNERRITGEVDGIMSQVHPGSACAMVYLRLNTIGWLFRGSCKSKHGTQHSLGLIGIRNTASKLRATRRYPGEVKTARVQSGDCCNA